MLNDPEPYESSIADLKILEEEVFPINEAFQKVFGRDKELKLLERGELKESQIERELRRDPELFELKREIGKHSHQVEELKLIVDVLKSYFFRNKDKSLI